jgi:hypothetical protein
MRSMEARGSDLMDVASSNGAVVELYATDGRRMTVRLGGNAQVDRWPWWPLSISTRDDSDHATDARPSGGGSLAGLDGQSSGSWQEPALMFLTDSGQIAALTASCRGHNGSRNCRSVLLDRPTSALQISA